MMFDYLTPIDYQSPGFGELYDELPLWSAPFGLLLLEQIELRRGITILDVGAGTGFLSIELAQRCGAEATVIAVDPWEAAMSRLARKIERVGLRNVRTITGDVAAIDLPDASVDLIVSNLGINNFADADGALRACFRVARPGAQLVLTTNLVGHMQEFYDVYRDVLIELGMADRVAALNAHIAHRATVESVQGQLERSGFALVNVVTGSFRERFVDGSALLRHYFMRLGFVPAWKEIAPASDVERTFAALEARLNQVAVDRGELSLTIPMACIVARKPPQG